MPDFTPTYAPVTGDALTAAGLNNNFYRVTSGRSIYEIGNGHIESVNFDPAFQVRAHHVRPGQVGEAVSVGQVLPNDYFSDLGMGSVGYVAIVGAAVTFYQKYSASMSIFSASGFASVWRQFGPANAAFGAHLAAPDIRIKAFFLNHSAAAPAIQYLTHTQRECPRTVVFDGGSVDPAAHIDMQESRCTRHWNLLHPKMVNGTDPHDQLSAGWHTFGLAVLVEQNTFGQDTSVALEDMRLQLNGATGVDNRPLTYYAAVPRIRMYVRSCTAVRLL